MPNVLHSLPARPRGGARRFVIVAGVLWLATLATGFAFLAREEFTPAAFGTPVVHFPSGSAVAEPGPDRPTLILFAHPHCPCTRATLHELDGLLASLPRPVSATVLFTVPKGTPPGWEQGEQWQAAARIPGVRVAIDPDGSEAARFGVKGSGHVLLYEPSGRLSFAGGITPSRGHEGDNAGRSAVADLVLAGHSDTTRTPVFGCPLM